MAIVTSIKLILKSRKRSLCQVFSKPVSTIMVVYKLTLYLITAKNQKNDMFM